MSRSLDWRTQPTSGRNLWSQLRRNLPKGQEKWTLGVGYRRRKEGSSSIWTDPENLIDNWFISAKETSKQKRWIRYVLLMSTSSTHDCMQMSFLKMALLLRLALKGVGMRNCAFPRSPSFVEMQQNIGLDQWIITLFETWSGFFAGRPIVRLKVELMREPVRQGSRVACWCSNSLLTSLHWTNWLLSTDPKVVKRAVTMP